MWNSYSNKSYLSSMIAVVLAIILFGAAGGSEESSEDRLGHKRSSAFFADEEIPEGGITLYRIVGSKSISKVADFPVSGEDQKYQQDIVKHNEIWALLKTVIVPDYRKYLTEMVIFNGESQSSDAYVVKISDDLKTWRMNVAINYAYEDGVFNPRGYTHRTLVHEFGHIVALNDTQLDGLARKLGCKTYFAEDGCSREGSYINAFYDTFWAELEKEWRKGNNPDFYKNNSDRFVTEYAATSPLEDFAEVFADFVVKDIPSTQTAIKDKKIHFMKSYPKLVAVRDAIRAKM